MHIDQKPWNAEVRTQLSKRIREGTGRGYDAVFDFDNTLVCRNMGDPVAELLTLRGHVQALEIPAMLSLRHTPHANVPALPAGRGINDHYEGYLSAARGHPDQNRMYADAYAWAVWSMAGCSPASIARVSAEVYANGIGRLDSEYTDRILHVPGTSYPRPFCYPQMIDLIADLAEHGYRIWIVTSSTPWTVRWITHNVINPALLARGIKNGIEPDHIFGIGMKLKDPRGRIWTDIELTRADRAYAEMDLQHLESFQLAEELHYPLSCFEGKAELIKRHISEQPYLVAGDSANDIPMFRIARNCLWLNPIERKDPRVWEELRSDTDPARWMVQPTCSGAGCGFLEELPLAWAATPKWENVPANA